MKLFRTEVERVLATYVVPHKGEFLVVGLAGDEGIPAVIASCDDQDRARRIARLHHEDYKQRAKEGTQ